MEGVIILDTFETIVGHNPGFNVLTFICILCFLGFFIAGIVCAANCTGGEGFFGFLATLCIAIGLLTVMLNDPISEVRHEVYVEPTVNFADFQEKYEIVGQDGVVYIVREVDQNGEEIHD